MFQPKYFYSLLFISLLILVPNLGVLPVNIMEARNFITAREMVEDGNWLLTTLNGEPRYEKPPLPTWITAVFGFLFGFKSLFTMRLAVIAVTLLLAIYSMKLTQRLGFSRESALYSSLILITSFYIYFSGRDNQWDMYCHSFMIASIYYLLGILKGKEKPITNAVIGGLFLACSLLSKGPISMYTLLLPFLLAYGWVFKFNFKQGKAYNWALIIYTAIGLLVGMSWSLYIHWVDPEPLEKMAKVETSRWVNDYNSKPFYYYWSFFTQSGIWTVFALLGLIYPYVKKRATSLPLYKFTLIWTLGSLFLLSIVPEKKTRYLLPILIPLALNTTFYIEYLIRSSKIQLPKLDVILGYFGFGILGIVGLIYPFVLYFVFSDKIQGQEFWAITSSIILLITGSIILYFLSKRDFKRVFYATIFLQCSVIAVVFPLAKAFLFPPNYYPIKNIKTFTENKIKLYDYNYMTPEIVWQYGQKIPTVNIRDINKILENNKITKIGLLVQLSKSDSIKSFFQDNNKYKINKVSSLDLNMVPKENKDYRHRLYRDFFIISKIE